MRRRALTLTALGAVLLRSADGVSQARLRTIGVLDGGDPGPMLAELRAGLSGLGHQEGRTYRLEVRSGSNAPATLRRHADDLVRLKVEVLLVGSRLLSEPPWRRHRASPSSWPPSAVRSKAG